MKPGKDGKIEFQHKERFAFFEWKVEIVRLEMRSQARWQFTTPRT
jgi:hypothetical protein